MRKTKDILLLWIFLSILSLSFPVKSHLAVGFYSSSCPNAESIVKSTVETYFKNDPAIAAGLLRLHFHDCMVQGCDGSVLIMNGNSEIRAKQSEGLTGFEVVDAAKEQLEKLCPGVVSCADILALAARDAVELSDGPSWYVPTGRRDGFVSESLEAEALLPEPFESIDVHIKKFADVGLTALDLVTLVGAHTIGHTDCEHMSYRLGNFTGTGEPDPSINPMLLKKLQNLCPVGGDPQATIEMDKESKLKFDNSFYKNLIDGNGVLESDQRLWSHHWTRGVVQWYADNVTALLNDFKIAMVKLGSINVKIGTEGEIRKHCSQFNWHPTSSNSSSS